MLLDILTVMASGIIVIYFSGLAAACLAIAAALAYHLWNYYKADRDESKLCTYEKLTQMIKFALLWPVFLGRSNPFFGDE